MLDILLQFGAKFKDGRLPEVGDRYQKEVGRFVEQIKPTIMVETGVFAGSSTAAILSAMDNVNHGTLYSIDPFPVVEMNHPRWHLLKETSVNAMPTLYEQTGPWDCFLHDSDHDCECQNFEYELGFACLKAEGYLMSDDITWGTPPHHAWGNFLTRHKLTCSELGHARVTQKPKHLLAISKDYVHDRAKYALDIAHKATIAYGERPKYFIK